MKVSKLELKALVKECLVEILQEGIGGSLQSAPLAKTAPSPAPLLQRSFGQKSKLPEARTPSPHLREAIKREAGGNRVMESILADTAASTLPKMIENDRPGMVSSPVPGGIAEQVVAAANPEDLFGDDVASKWASLAFMDSPTKK